MFFSAHKTLKSVNLVKCQQNVHKFASSERYHCEILLILVATSNFLPEEELSASQLESTSIIWNLSSEINCKNVWRFGVGAFLGHQANTNIVRHSLLPNLKYFTLYF